MKHVNRNTLVFGCFGFKANQLDGQTIKTRELYKLLQERQEGVVSYADTRDFVRSVKSIVRFICDLVRCDTLVYLPARNNLRLLFVSLYLCSKVFRFEILYVVIGGWLCEFISERLLLRKCLGKIRHIYTENELMLSQLRMEYGFENVTKIPNFRFGEYTPSFDVTPGKLKLVFMARINKKKGVDVVFELADYIKEKYENRAVTIDMYGPIFPDDKEYFENNIRKYDCVSYKGELQPELIPQTLDRYDVMLFPTHYYTEGFPGTVLDAYRAGIPVIASEWKHAHEFVKDQMSGYVIPFEDNVAELCGKVDYLFCNTDTLVEMKHSAYDESKRYTPDAAWKVLSASLR